MVQGFPGNVHGIAENATDWCKVSCVLWLPVPTVQRAVAMHGTAADCKVVIRTSVVR